MLDQLLKITSDFQSSRKTPLHVGGGRGGGCFWNTHIGITGTALQWFSSYLGNRSQRVVFGDGVSESFYLACGVPQGSCLGPLLFTLYASKLFEVIKHHLPSAHAYADDTQLNVSFKVPLTP